MRTTHYRDAGLGLRSEEGLLWSEGARDVCVGERVREALARGGRGAGSRQISGAKRGGSRWPPAYNNQGCDHGWRVFEKYVRERVVKVAHTLSSEVSLQRDI
ncbi:hypothetical protein MGYG_09018 [Nannizzia gypsea CBS 118893]|uniref:Uncharacterized protein n=1 Tax=Arthroderma gypseum (strain ATCC MYA-4604 / CBS 118893) TaxID=535722 RepID=E4URW1_ARTGP|nr:hypothetical protein MGYG_09018 [Nannizzia gypsea CBS 118893]EFR00432.1 hypothetical protein MGYG_09018 [Nannizzia gypsea CBS 118893]